MDKKLVLCIGIFLAFSLASFFLPFFSSDEYGYMSSGREVASGEFASAGDTARFPLLPFLLGVIYRIFGFSELATNLFVMLLGVGGVILIYEIAKATLGSESAFLSALFLVSNPLYLYLSTRVLTEPLFFFLLIASFHLLLRMERSWVFSFLFGLATAGLILTRYIGALFLLAAGVYLWAAKGRSLFTLKNSAVFAVGFLLPLIPWFLFSFELTGNPIGLALTFLTQQVALNETVFSLPDKLPLYLVVLPFLLGFASPLYWRGAVNYVKGRLLKNNLFALAAIVSIVFYAALELYGFFNVALLRYIVPIVPFLALFAGANRIPFQLKGFEVNWKVVYTLVVLNLLVAAVVFSFFASYPKYIGYREAGQWASENCASVNSNIQKVVFHYNGKENANEGECSVISDYDGFLEPLPEQRLAFESHGVKVYKDNG